jgi:phenylpropionate dioxygenase-like ring-hydroxylating dioxygenase large terminal subunit
MALLEISGRERADVVEGYGLPSHLYTSREVLEIERKEIFGKTWQFAVHESDISSPGSYALARLGEFEVIVTRDLDGQVHAMRNVCLHRGATLIDCAGRGTLLRCPYHAWTYGLDGKLRSAPGFQRDSRVKPGVSGLAPVRLARFGPLIFANLHGDSPDLSEVIGPIQHAADRWSEVKHAETREYRYDCNWKIAMENSLECYHCPVVHPGFNTLIDTQNYACDIFEFCAIAGGDRRGNADARSGRIYGSATAEGASDVQTYFIWPNLWLLSYPGPSNLVVARWLPQGVERSVCLRSIYFGDDFPAEKRDEFIAYIEQIQTQDLKICGDVYRNISTGAFQRSLLRFGGGGLTEEVIPRFQELVISALTRGAGAGRA